MPFEENMASSCNGIPSSPFFPPNFFLQMQTPQEEHPLNPHDFSRGMAGMIGRGSLSFSGNLEACDGEDELSDECSQLGEKKRRLNMEQVRTLEKNFELGNKLEPERKMQLARALGLQPRQIAIWFQNRRARWKTKQLEKDYDVLKRQYDAIKAENGALLSQNKKLHAEILVLKGREAAELINLNKETEGSCSNRSENSSEINFDKARALNSGGNPIQSISFFPANRQAGSGGAAATADEHFSNLICGMEEQNAFWSWSDHNNFHQ